MNYDAKQMTRLVYVRHYGPWQYGLDRVMLVSGKYGSDTVLVNQKSVVSSSLSSTST